MYLREFKSILGISVDDLTKFAKKYRILSACLYLLDICAIAGLSAYMFYHNAQVQWYGVALVAVCVLVNFVFSFKLGTQKHDIFKFYKKNKNSEVQEFCYSLTWPDLRDVLEHAGLKVGQDDKISVMKSAMIAACQKDIKLMAKFMRLLHKYECAGGMFQCYAVVRNGKKFFIDFIEEDTDGNHHSGAVEEPDSESTD